MNKSITSGITGLSRECNQTPSVLVFGLIALDMIFQVDEMPTTPEKYVARDAEWGIGGGGANAALALQRLGGRAFLAGRIGDDAPGQLVLTKLNSEQVDCSGVVHLERSRSAISSIFINRHGERQIVNFRGDVPNDGISSAESKLDVTSLDHCDAVLVDTRWEEGAIAVLKAARKRGIPSVVDSEAPTSHEAMMLATHIAFSRQGLRDYAGTNDIEPGLKQAHRQFGQWVCVTDGENGVYDLCNDRLQHTPGYCVDAVDTLAAGDVWHAAFTLQLANDQSETDAMKYANAASALKCSRRGGASGAPDWREVEAFIAKLND